MILSNEIFFADEGFQTRYEIYPSEMRMDGNQVELVIKHERGLAIDFTNSKDVGKIAEFLNFENLKATFTKGDGEMPNMYANAYENKLHTNAPLSYVLLILERSKMLPSGTAGVIDTKDKELITGLTNPNEIAIEIAKDKADFGIGEPDFLAECYLNNTHIEPSHEIQTAKLKKQHVHFEEELIFLLENLRLDMVINNKKAS